jgi:uncharacterized protein
MVYSSETLRTLALHTQGLATKANPKKPTADDIYKVIETMGCLQLDTLQMVARSQYVAIWSRLGSYNPADLDALLSGDGQDKNTRRIFEYWYHAACYIPLTEYWSIMPKMQEYRSQPSKWAMREFGGEAEMRAALDMVMNRIREEGGLRSSDFENPQREKSGWWDWKPAKSALEILYFQGHLMIADRPKFQKVYDLAERVLPDWVDTRERPYEESIEHILELTAKRFGVCQPIQLIDYYFFWKPNSTARPLIEKMLKDGRLVKVEGQLADGKMVDMVVHRDHLTTLQQAADKELRAERTTFLSPFDSVLYARERNREIWGFNHVIEAYTPRPKQIWGYFCLPILWRGQLIGRFDPKLERKTKTLRLKALHLEPNIKPTDKMVAEVAGAMRDFLKFHAAETLIIEKSNPSEFGEMLMKAM